ncbi:MAG: VWA domain-containing protein [Phycisphaerae bacterium]|nr:VWA domain-containing protein [Phycisphaerae bacterium]
MQTSMLWWGLLLAVPIVLYLFRPRPQTVRVTTLPFFRALAREHQESAWLRMLKRLLSLLLTLAVIAGVVLGLSRLVRAPAAGSVRNVVVLVDVSASMAARDADGRSRLVEAVAWARERIDGLNEGVSVALMTYDRRPRILVPPTLDRRQVRHALEAIEVRPIPGHGDRALEQARQLAVLQTPAVVWHLTDRAPEAPAGPSPPEPEGPPAAATSTATGAADGEEPAAPDVTPDAAAESAAEPGSTEPGQLELPAPKTGQVTVQHVNLGLSEPINVGITAFQLRRAPLQAARYEAFVQIQAAGDQTVAAELEVRIDGRLTAIRELSLEPGERRNLLVPVDADQEKILTLKLSAKGDVFDLDDQVQARVPAMRPLKLLWVSPAPDPFTQLALTSLGREGEIAVFQAGPDRWPVSDPIDVVLFDGWLPEQWPADIPAIVINPPGSSGPVQARPLQDSGLPLDRVRVTNEQHPILFGVASSRVAVTQTAVLPAGGSLEPLWVGPSGPVLAAGEVEGQRITVMSFAPVRSEQLPLLASYPLLLGNAIYWGAAPALSEALGNNLRTGHLVEVEGGRITWSGTDGDEQTVDLKGTWAELDRLGLWQDASGEMRGSAALLSRGESQLPPAPADAADAGVADKLGGGWLRGELTVPLLFAVLATLIIESWLFHRHAVY